MSDWFQLDKEYMMSTYCRTQVAMERGEGCKLYDVDGKEYLDLFSGVGVNVRIQSPKIVQNDNGASYEIVASTVSFLNPVAIGMQRN